MATLTIKLPPGLEQEMERASQREHLTKSELARRAIRAYIEPRDGTTPFVSALEQAGDLVGCFEGGPEDLASSSRHLEDYGRV